METLCALDAAYNLIHEVEKSCLVHEPGSIVCTVGKQVFHPWPALSEGVDNGLRSCTVGDIGGGQVDHKQPPVCIHSDMALATDDFLIGIEATVLGGRSLDRLAIDGC